MNVNPRSIYNKVENLKTYITENNVDLVCVSESWARKSQPIEEVLKMDNYTVICNPNLRRQIGGTPAIIVNASKFIVDIPDITPPWGAEIVWCVLTLKNTTTSSLVKRLVVGSFYSKPGSRKKTELLDHIAETVHYFCSKYPDSVSFCISGDKNDMSIDSILSLRPDFKQCVEDPTRLSPPAILDVIITDLGKFYRKPVCEPALEVDEDKEGTDSDHLMVLMQPLDNFNNKKGSLKKQVQYRPLNDAGYSAMENNLNEYDWSFLYDIQSSDEQMLTFHNQLYEMFNESFPMKSKTFFSQTEPWFTEKLSTLKRKKEREFSKHRKSQKYKDLHKIYKNELSVAKTKYYDLKLRNLRSTNPRSWYRSLKKIMNNDSEEKIEVDSIRHLTDTEQVEAIASKFAEISNSYDCLDRSQINIPEFTPDQVPVVTVAEVIEILKGMDSNKSTRPGDIPVKIFKRFATQLAQPISNMINQAIVTGVWPDFLKLEIVTPIPKIKSPKSIEDLRKISGLMVLNKIMEKAVCRYVVEDMKTTLDPAQFGNQKGMGVQHYLVKLLDRVLSATDRCSRGAMLPSSPMLTGAKHLTVKT